MLKPTFDLEHALHEEGCSFVIGIDESGRGTLAASVFAVSVYVPPEAVKYLVGVVDDSKKLSAKKRNELNRLIRQTCLYQIASVNHETIDRINILNATKLAIVNTMDYSSSIFEGFTPCHALIDGNMSFTDAPIFYTSVVKGDCKSVSVACASVVAKEARDGYMCKLAEKYPEYGFEIHKGYATKMHRDAIKKYGPCPVHRKTFRGVKEYL